MVSQPHLDLKNIIDVLKSENSTCLAHWQKVKLYDMDPWEFQSFAKQDLEDNSERGRINALGNAKRAIECRVDELLTLLNFRCFSASYRWGLPYKMRILKTFGISAPNILLDYIAQKRNLLEHEYLSPKDPEQIRYVADLAELFLSATDKHIEKGYIYSAAISHTRYKGEWQKGGRVNTRTENEDEYKLTFDLGRELIEVSYEQRELFSEWYLRTGEIKTRVKTVIAEENDTIAISDCKEANVRELMKLLREKTD